MCCDPIEPEEAVGDCPNCGEPVDKDGESALRGCYYSPILCFTCNDRPCDLSC